MHGFSRSRTASLALAGLLFTMLVVGRDSAHMCAGKAHTPCSWLTPCCLQALRRHCCP